MSPKLFTLSKSQKAELIRLCRWHPDEDMEDLIIRVLTPKQAIIYWLSMAFLVLFGLALCWAFLVLCFSL